MERIRETYRKGYSTLAWEGVSLFTIGKFYHRKCNNDGYIIYDNSGDMFYQDFMENLKSMQGYKRL